MKAQFKVGDLVIEDTSMAVLGPAARKGMIRRIITDPKGRLWYELQFFGSDETIEWVELFAHRYLKHYKVEDNESTV